MRKISRRRFLRGGLCLSGTVAAAAVPYIVPSSALGKDGAVSPSERITMGGIGMGGQGVRDMRNFMTCQDVQFVAVCDADSGRCEQAKAIVDENYASKDCTAYADFRRLLARADIDAVLSATGERWHALTSIYAARAGKDIYCEKPMSLTVAEGRAVADITKRYGTVYQCGTQRRSMRSFAFAVNVARNGQLGEMHTLHSYVKAGRRCRVLTPEPVPDGFDYEMWLGPTPFIPYNSDFVKNLWKNHFDYSGGMITDWGAHCNDLAQMANDSELTDPVEYEGTAEFPEQGFCNVPVALHVEARYADGVRLIMYDKKSPDIWPNMNGELSVKFEGAEGWIYVDDGGNVDAHPKSLLQSRKFEKQRWTDAANWQGHHRNFLDCVKTRARTIASAEVAHRSTTTCHVANICLRLGRHVSW
ncbi:MAG: Gfo/Idh/MocA family protein, partial [Planctomycetota bacterium]